MAEFDPDAYLAGGSTPQEKPFDPDVYLGSTSAQSTATGFNPDAYLNQPAGHTGSPGVLSYPFEIGKDILKGGVEAAVASPLRGAAVQPPSTRVNQFAFSPGELELMDQDFRETLTKEQILNHPFYKAGEAVTNTMKGMMPERDIYPKVMGKDVIRDLSGGLGSVGGNIASMMVAPTMSISTMPLQGAGEATERAIKANATPEQIQRAGQLGNIAGATEFADALLPHLGSWGKVAGLMKKVGVNTLKGVFIEGGQEGLQQFIQNSIAKGVYKPGQDLSEDVAYNFVIGGIIGGGVGAATTRREAPVMPPAQETIDASVAPVVQPSPTMPVPGQAPVTSPTPVGMDTVAQPLQAPVVGADRILQLQKEINDAEQRRNIAASINDDDLVKHWSTQIDTLTQEANAIRGIVPPTPTLDEAKAQTLSPQIVDHIQKQAPPLRVPEVQPGLDQLVAPTSNTLSATTFRTAKGSTYTLHEDGTTTRNKAARSDVGHEGDSGPKPRTIKTFYVDPVEAPKFNPPEGSKWRIIDHGDGTLSIATFNETGPNAGRWGISPDDRNIKTEAAPRVGLSPIELWKPDKVNGHDAYRGVHPGNVITEITQGLQSSDVALREEIRSAPGANTARLAKLLGPKLYGDPTDITPVSVKEMFQNSFDALKGVLEKGQDTAGNIDINMDPKTRTVSVHDDGSGMTPQVLAKQFLEIAGTNKETKRASGGLGIAKMLFIFGNKNLRVITMRDGKVAELNTTGEQLFSALDDQSKAPNINVRTPTTKDLRMFPKGRGTLVEVKVPDQYQDPSTGEAKKIGFDTWDGAHPVLRNSPLFSNISIKFNGEELALGSQFPVEDYTQFANVKFDWGTARVYISQKEDEYSKYGNNVHILSNGLWQFSTKIKKDPSEMFEENLPRQIFIDINSKAAPEEPGYPFDLNRQGFSPTTKKGFDNLTKYIGLLFNQQDLQQSAHNFGTMQFLDYDGDTKSVRASHTIQIEPKSPPPPDALSLIPQGKIESVTVVDGELRVNGRKVPDLTPGLLGSFKINPASLRVDQSEIDPQRVILHDNVEIQVSHSETRSVVDYGREKFGKRFDEYVYAIGNAFKELRDVVVKGMPKVEEKGPTAEQALDALLAADGPSMIRLGKKALKAITNAVKPVNGYEALGTEGIGVSFDAEYRGVSITVPFRGMFLNPVVPEYTDQVRAALGMVGTMVHELAHYKVRSHDAAFPAEMQRILIMLDSNTEFNYHGFKQKVINIVNGYHDVLTHMNGVFTSGDFLTRPRGKRFEDTSANEARDGRPLGDMGVDGPNSESGSRLSDWVAASEAIPEGESGRVGASYQTSSSGSHRPSDNGRGRNYAATRAIDSGISAPPQQPEVNILRDTVKNSPAGTGSVPAEIKEAASHADRFNWMYKYLAGVTQLLDGNPYFQPLRKYVERVRAMHSDESKIHDAALRLMKEWRRLGSQMKNLEELILDIQQMPYLSPTERKLGVTRQPTAAEFSAIASKHKVSDAALQVYNKMRQMDETFLQLLEFEAKENARRRIPDPIKLAARIDEIEATGRLARQQPFFPFTRFGRYYVTVKDAAGNVLHFETFEPARAVGFTTRRAETYQAAKVREIEKKLKPGQTVTSGVLPETAEPLIGLPTLLLQELLGEDVSFTKDQVEAIKLMQSSRNPAMGLKQRAGFQDNSVTGVSRDLPRSFAKYYFHGGRYYAKVKHSWALRGHVAEAQVIPGNKAGLIASYMGDHLTNTVLDAKGDFGFWKGAIFLWAMGYSVAAATTNLTQTPFVSYPFLAAKFGDLRATKHMIKSMLDVTNYYRRGAYVEPSPTTTLDFEMKAVGYGVKTGRISETQAPELAGLAGGGKLISGMGGGKVEQAAAKFQEKAALAFELAEQFNRRVVYRAALRLAQENPNAKFVKESIEKYQGEYQQLVAEFGSEAKAAAVVSAIHATDQTQFVYAKYARSKLFRGPKNILFVFKQYISSLLWMLGNNKADVLPRWIVIAMLMGGLGGVPGYDDLKGIIRAIGIWFFGKDVNLDRMIRDWALQWFNGTVSPDVVLHGLARRGFGIPAIVDMMGSTITGQPGRGLDPKNQHSTNVPFPVLDRSKAIGVGNILPLDVGKMFTPTDKLDKTIADEAHRASGAVFSVGFNMYKAIMDRDSPVNDYKRWEKAMPRALSSASRAYRAFSEGRERGGKGGPNSAPTIINYDVRDTEQMMEVIAMGLGYQPLRQQAKWDLIMAQAESSAFYDMRKKDLLEEWHEAMKGANPHELQAVREAVVKYNRELPDYAKAMSISGDTIRKSMQTRERTVIHREMGIPVQKSKTGITQEMQRLFPEATIDVRRVR